MEPDISVALLRCAMFVGLAGMVLHQVMLLNTGMAHLAHEDKAAILFTILFVVSLSIHFAKFELIRWSVGYAIPGGHMFDVLWKWWKREKVSSALCIVAPRGYRPDIVMPPMEANGIAYVCRNSYSASVWASCELENNIRLSYKGDVLADLPRGYHLVGFTNDSRYLCTYGVEESAYVLWDLFMRERAAVHMLLCASKKGGAVDRFLARDWDQAITRRIVSMLL